MFSCVGGGCGGKEGCALLNPLARMVNCDIVLEKVNGGVFVDFLTSLLGLLVPRHQTKGEECVSVGASHAELQVFVVAAAGDGAGEGNAVFVTMLQKLPKQKKIPYQRKKERQKGKEWLGEHREDIDAHVNNSPVQRMNISILRHS